MALINTLYFSFYWKDLLENLKPSTGTASEKLRDVYNSCMNQGKMHVESFKIMCNLLAVIIAFTGIYILYY